MKLVAQAKHSAAVETSLCRYMDSPLQSKILILRNKNLKRKSEYYYYKMKEQKD